MSLRNGPGERSDQGAGTGDGWWRQRWGGHPRWVRWTLVVYALGFAEGACAHLADIVRGGVHVYASFGPAPLQLYFLSLVVLDPLAVAGALLVRTWGPPLAAAVMATDVAGNWVINWRWLREDPAWLLRPVGLLPITLFGIFVVATAAPVRKAIGRDRRRGPAAFLRRPGTS
ncbi:hypothetical protein AB0I49_22545 [Streptomyces sp. NPDC050617]|uniref:hypothetical protein n=1 Tax=Streptomyces sp. NPDC050617 TaxID=3154628 RepID=UPI00341CF184